MVCVVCEERKRKVRERVRKCRLNKKLKGDFKVILKIFTVFDSGISAYMRPFLMLLVVLLCAVLLI